MTRDTRGLTPLHVAVRYGTAFVVAVVVGRLSRGGAAEISLVLPAAGVAALWLARATTTRQALVFAGLQVALGAVLAPMTGAYAELGAVLTAGTTAGAGATVAVWRGLSGARPQLRTLAHGVHLVVASSVGSVVSALVGLVLAALAGPPTSAAVSGAVLLVAVRTGLGTFLVLAVAVAWSDARATRSAPEVLRRGAIDSLLTVAVFGGLFALADERVAAYGAVPLTVLLAVRRGVLGTAWHLAVASSATVGLMLAGIGPFSLSVGLSAALVAQGFLSVLSLVGMGLALLRSEQHTALEAAATTAARLRRTVDSALIAHLTVTVHGDGRVDVARANPAAAAFFGRPAEELVGRSLLDHVVPHHRLEALASLLAVGTGRAPSWSGELEYDLGGGAHRWALVSAAPMDGGDDLAPAARLCGASTLSLQLMDVTDRVEAQARLAHLATHDPLTDLANRALLTRAVEDALATSSTAVVLVDLDGFKQVNDALGHAAGDAVLVETARRLRSAARVGDTVARLGGDEFVVCSPGVETVEDAERIRERVRDALAGPWDVDGIPVAVGASVGVTLSAEHSTASVLLAASDAAMYEVKRGGRAAHLVH
ncbi:diguanylate cyclase domain-containing protein [Cellulomonas carbonis]|uniref:Diguanylate cyclase n=1 Tax=Cellulomonas carbonis T26 TaxID=947969 RepID=A0A0A0BVX0_9CELL|nr:diguanylate cyclase [Cellulomonas carbonis]KGM11279.1 hypothetical protein N868_11345 [Cellulomonas carbonis T26]GGC18038.1 hypothetical protein GCM10010972_34070 [Cellulomonas carbonis]